MLGAAVGSLQHTFLPHLSGPIGTYALVGMGVLFAGFLRAPMTSVFMVLEVSGNYSIILPVIIANTLAYLISRSFQPVPIFDILTRQDGLQLPSMEEQREETILRVEDAMRLPYIPVLKADLTVGAALAEIAKLPQETVLVDRPDSGWCFLSRRELESIAAQGKQDGAMAAVLPASRMPYLYPDHTLDTALRQLQDWPLLPVVHRADPHLLVGILSLEDILNTYRNAAETVGVTVESGLA
jgi:CIC family chloride channel protein